nr:MAG: hypothetical protein [Otus scops adenovirus]
MLVVFVDSEFILIFLAVLVAITILVFFLTTCIEDLLAQNRQNNLLKSKKEQEDSRHC